MADDRTPSDTIRIGRVMRAHGLLGELEVRPDWSDSRGLLDASQVMLESAEGRRQSFGVTRARQTPKGTLMLLAGVSDRDAAEALRGQTVSVPRESLPSLAEGEYYLCDLVGLSVCGTDGPIGNVVEVQMYPSVDAIVIETPTGERLEQPLLDQWVERVELKERRITLASQDGLIEVPRAPGAKAFPGGSER
jgi:16S rRNA processing protein RimM